MQTFSTCKYTVRNLFSFECAESDQKILSLTLEDALERFTKSLRSKWF
jgi:hypothetical protein